MGRWDDSRTINSIPGYHDGTVTTDYQWREEEHMLLAKWFCIGAV